MNSLFRIFRTVAVVAAFCLLTASYCSVPGADVELSLTVESETVPAMSGQIFVSIKSNSAWTAELADANGGSAVDWARLNSATGEGNRNLLLSYDANTDEAMSRKVMVTVKSGDIARQAYVEQAAAGKHPEPDPDPDPEPEPDKGPDLSKTGWMELPALNDPDLGYYSHSFEMNGKTYRNYSFGWSQKNGVSLWVAYPLCKMYTAKNVQRKDEWATDPLLGNDSTNPGSYYGRLNPTDKGEDPYARGHQLPSADRLCIREANRQTFYGTNITPQLFDHNGGIWSDLEGRVRVIAEKSDTTYVVTGCLVEGGRTVYDTDGQPMTVPTAYFKALLRYSKSSTLGQWNAAAFYLEHRAYSENIGKQHSMSIDELEEITGIDFFANLPAKIGESQADKVEAADPADSSIWW